MRCRRRFFWPALALAAGVLAAPELRADPGDVESSHDYPGFARLPGFVISDYDEDNPAEFDFPVARPLPIDADHVEMVPVRGHRYVIRYEAGANGQDLTLLQTQEYYEKLAAAAGFEVEKTGAVRDVTETFHRVRGSHDIWVYLEPDVAVNVLTVVESSGTAPPPPRLSAASPPPKAPATGAGTVSITSAEPPVVVTIPTADDLYAALIRDGRVVVPLNFVPGKPDLQADAQAMVDRIVAMMKLHPQLLLRIEGHTDNSGDPEDNLRLSALRALAVQAMLVAGAIDKSRLDAVGVGGLQPLDDNDTAEGREKNRRIELVVRKKHPSFHSPAPNGQNYYPGAGGSLTSQAGV
jgi:outer membrane protein OmpA-like peptidoglycan-associated protein